MKRLVSFLCMLCTVPSLQAQEKTVTGTVTDLAGQPLSGASIKIKGTNRGTTADDDGKFTVRIKPGGVLMVSAIDFAPQQVTVGDNPVITIKLTRADAQLSEVIVTAQGIRRKPKEIGYSVATIRNEQFTNGRSAFLGPGLAGKVSGLQVSGLNNSVNQDVRITLRGNRSITGDNKALIVLDGVPVPQSTLSGLNPNDIENVTILKGGQAATLYGSEGVNGALLITTRKGNAGKPQITFSSSNSIDEVSFLPKFQEEFGSGSGYGNTPRENFRIYENQSFGDRFDGSIRPVGKTQPDGSYLQLPYSAVKDGKKKIWDKGFSSMNDVSISGGDQTTRFYLSFQNFTTKSVVPRDELKRNAFRFNGSKDFGKLTASVNLTYAQTQTKTTYSDFYSNVLNTAAHIPLKDLRDWKNNKFANPNGYYNEYSPSPWFELDQQRQDSGSAAFNGNFQLNFEPIEGLQFTYRLGVSNINTFLKRYEDKFIYSAWAKDSSRIPPGAGHGGTRGSDEARTNDRAGFVRDGLSYTNRLNSDFFITFDKQYKDFTAKFIAGQNVQVRRTKSSRVQVNSLSIPGIFNVGNRAGGFDDVNTREENTMLRKYGYYGDLTIGYKDFIFLHATGRLDASSVFYDDNRSSAEFRYPYYGADLSFILTDAVPSLKSEILQFAKLRIGANKNGNDNLDPYRLTSTFSRGTGFPYGSNVGATVDDVFFDKNLKPEFITSFEAGLELSLLKGRINLDANAYTQKSEGQIIEVSISEATGFTRALINAANSKNWGYEFDLKAQVIKSADLSWDVSTNYSYNDNEVTSLFGGVRSLQLNTISFNRVEQASVTARVGDAFPYLRVRAYERDPGSGKIIVDPVTGYPSAASDFKSIGRTIPKHILGIGTSLRYKDFSFSANMEYRGGYYIYHGIGNSLSFSGVGYNTAIYGRENFVLPNSVYLNNGKYVDNASISVRDGAYAFWDTYYAVFGEPFVTSGAFWKLRDASVSYNVPAKYLGRVKFLKGASVTLFGRNLFVIVPKENIYNDPEFLTRAAGSNENGVGISSDSNNPPSRTYGVSVQLKF